MESFACARPLYDVSKRIGRSFCRVRGLDHHAPRTRLISLARNVVGRSSKQLLPTFAENILARSKH
jgi:hypothetical protein